MEQENQQVEEQNNSPSQNKNYQEQQMSGIGSNSNI